MNRFLFPVFCFPVLNRRQRVLWFTHERFMVWANGSVPLRSFPIGSQQEATTDSAHLLTRFTAAGSGASWSQIRTWRQRRIVCVFVSWKLGLAEAFLGKKHRTIPRLDELLLLCSALSSHLSYEWWFLLNKKNFHLIWLSVERRQLDTTSFSLWLCYMF